MLTHQRTSGAGRVECKAWGFLYPGMIIGSINRVFQAMMGEVGDIAFVNVRTYLENVGCYVVSGYLA